MKPANQKPSYLRLTNRKTDQAFPENFENIFEQRKKEADEFYECYTSQHDISADQENIQRQAFAGLLWSKQYYHYDVERWLNTSDGITPVTDSERHGPQS